MTGNGISDPHKQLLWLENEKSLVLQTEGSDLHHLASVLNDAIFIPLPAPAAMLATLTPTPLGDSKQNETESKEMSEEGNEVRIHAGFLAAWSRSYPQSLKAVQAGLLAYPSTERLILVGHSLGAAIAQLDLLALHSDLNNASTSTSATRSSNATNLSYQYYGFGTPRVFNSAGSALVDQFLDGETDSVPFPVVALASSSSSSPQPLSSSSSSKSSAMPSSTIDFYHVHHASDVVPHLGPLSFGFRHAQHEVFLPDTDRTDVNKTAQQQEALLCGGTENAQCSLSRGNDVNIVDHTGPYFGLLFSSEDDC